MTVVNIVFDKKYLLDIFVNMDKQERKCAAFPVVISVRGLDILNEKKKTDQ